MLKDNDPVGKAYVQIERVWFSSCQSQDVSKVEMWVVVTKFGHRCLFFNFLREDGSSDPRGGRETKGILLVRP